VPPPGLSSLGGSAAELGLSAEAKAATALFTGRVLVLAVDLDAVEVSCPPSVLVDAKTLAVSGTPGANVLQAPFFRGWLGRRRVVRGFWFFG
jgi:hypothetical protein